MPNTTSTQTSTPAATPSAQTPTSTPVIPPALNLAVTLAPATAKPPKFRILTGKKLHKTVCEISSRILNDKSGFKPKKLCSGFTFSAGTACFYSCRYCYVEDMISKAPGVQDLLAAVNQNNQGVQKGFQDVIIRRQDPIGTLTTELRNAKGALKYKGGKYAAARAAGDPMVIYGSPLVDIAAHKDLVEETIKMVQILLNDTDFDIRLLSKSPMIVDIAKSLSPNQKNRVIFGLSIGTFDYETALAIEKHCPPPQKRIEALHWLQDNGYRTYGMVCPILPQPMEQYVALVKEHIRPEKCEHIWAEVVNVRKDSMKLTSTALEEAGKLEALAALKKVCGEEKDCKANWEQYAKDTFTALAAAIPRDANGQPKLRFLQYEVKATRDWWKAQVPNGAILLTEHAQPTPTATLPPIAPIGTTQNQLALAPNVSNIQSVATSVVASVTLQAKVKAPKWIAAGKKAWATRLANRAAAQNGQPVQPKVKNPKWIEAGKKAWATRVANKSVAQAKPASVLTGGETSVA